MIYTHALAAIAAALVASAGAWQVQHWRYTGHIQRLQADHAQVLTAAQDAAMATERRYQDQLNKARNDATKRETKLRRDAAAARAAADGLRDNIYAFRARLPTASDAARAVAADTAAELLGACVSRYRDVAEAADRHAADAMMLRDAWPTAEPR